MTVPAHTEVVHVDDVELIDAHAPRSDSPLFRRNRALLLARIGKCWVDNDRCGQFPPLEAHHLLEWSQADKADWDKLHDTLLAIDPYGYSHAQAGQPLHGIDDLRNLILLCPVHHRGTGIGVHGGITFPELIAMKARLAGTSITQAEADLAQQPSEHLAAPGAPAPAP